ncbi:MAG: hypothetical protein ABS900_09570, partial [Candidatus Limivicinus sp.]
MKYRSKAFLFLILIIYLLMTTGCGTLQAYASDRPYESGVLLVRRDWADDVKQSLNDLMATCGKTGTTPAESPYAVFDFDNTSCIFDVEEQLAV